MGALEPFLPGCSIDILPSRCSGPLEAFDVNGNGYHRASHCASGFDDEYTWCIDVPPAMCAGGGLYCYYYRDDPPDDCCNEEEGECCPPGVPKCPSKTAGNPVNILNGNNTELETDLEFDTPHKQGFKIYRTYKSRIHRDSPLGMGWTHNYNVILKSMGVQFADAYIIEDESNREHFYQSTPDTEIPGTYEGIMSTKGYLANESDGTFTWHRANGVTYTFNQQLQFIAKEDGIGNVQTLTYDVDGLLESVTDQATGRSIGYFYNADGLIDYITGPITTAVPDGIWVSYQYDIDGNLIFVEYADDGNGSIASGFEYLYEDPYDVHNLTEKRNLAGEFLSRWTYDSMDRAYENVTRDGKGVTINGYGTSNIVVTDAQGVDKTYTIDTINGRRTITYITGEGCSSCGEDAVRYGYDAYRRTNEIEYANGRIDQYADFDETDRYHTEIQAVGTSEERTFYYTYHPDTGDRLTITESSVLESGDKETIFDYDNDGNAVPNENPTTLIHRKIERGFTYDAAGTTVPYEHITLYTYNAKGQVLSVDGPLPGAQDETTYTYDPVTGDLLTETKPLVGTTTYGYDDAGNVTSIANPNGIVTTISYDGRNRQLSSNRNGVTNSFTYTAAGELNTTTDALNRTIDYTYNDAGFMDKIIDPSGNFIYYGYNSLGQRTEDSIYGPGDIQTHYRGTDFGDPAGNPDLVSGKPWKSIHRNHDDTADLETVYGYDSSGNLASVTDANGNTTTYHYDLFDRLYQVIQPENATTTYTYDTHGNLVSVTDAEGHVTI